MRIGNKKRSQITAKNKVTLTKMPTYIVPVNSEPIKDTKPAQRTIVVIMMALPEDTKVLLNANAKGFPFDSSILSLFKKCNVSSTAIPKAMVNIIEIEMFMSTPKYPIIPPINIRGNILGTRAISIILNDLKIIPTIIITTKNAMTNPCSRVIDNPLLFLSINSAEPVILVLIISVLMLEAMNFCNSMFFFL